MIGEVQRNGVVLSRLGDYLMTLPPGRASAFDNHLGKEKFYEKAGTYPA